MIDVVCYLFNSFGINRKPGRLILPKWVKVNEERFNEILGTVTEERNQQGEGLKILTPDQMLSRLPITLARLKAGNNSQKLKNEIRQLFYSLYRFKKLTKQFFKSLVDVI